MRQSWETMTSVSAGHIILTPTQPVGRDRQTIQDEEVVVREGRAQLCCCYCRCPRARCCSVLPDSVASNEFYASARGGYVPVPAGIPIKSFAFDQYQIVSNS